MVLSFMGNMQGRILHAHFNDKGLIIRKSRLYDFSTEEKADKSTELFLQYMASKMEGETAFSGSLNPSTGEEAGKAKVN